MTHEEMNELYELYTLGALETELATEIDAHVMDQCAYCIQRIHEAINTTSSLAGLTDAMEPPREVRERILAAVGRPPRQNRTWQIGFGVLLAACLGLLTVALWTTGELNATRRQLSLTLGQRDELVDILSRLQMRAASFGATNHTSHGRVFMDPNGGMVVVGTAAPSLANDRVLQLWLIPAKGSPQASGTFRPDSSGDFVYVSREVVDPKTVNAVAVTVEPTGGSQAPTTKPLWIVPVS